MTMLAYFGHNPHPLPPVVIGCCGAIRRINNDKVVTRPLKIDPSIDIERRQTIAEKARARQAHLRNTMLLLIEAGIDDARKLAKLSKCSPSTVWNHLKTLELDGVVKVDRRMKPWIITMRESAK